MCEPAQSDEYASALVALCSRLTLYILAGCVTLGIFLASQVHIDRIVTATGQLITREPTIIVQTLNRAIISSIDVREGDRVKAGDVLATLDPTFAAADVAQLEVEISIDARDIGFVRVADRVAVKLEAYNYLEHGHAEGRLHVLSEDAFTTREDDGKTAVRPFYNANAALLYPEGLDVAADAGKAFTWAKAAAVQGLPAAQANLGMLYLRGVGCERDFAEAARWYRTAAEKGNDAAATALGLLHIDGRGVDRDPVTARILLVGPARRGNGFAQAGLKRLRLLAAADAAPFTPRATAG